MDKNQEVLREFVNEKSKFLVLKDGQETTVEFLAAERITTNYQGKSVKSIRYKFRRDGKEFLWDRSSRAFADQISIFLSGDLLSIRVVGKGNQTKYTVRKVGESAGSKNSSLCADYSHNDDLSRQDPAKI